LFQLLCKLFLVECELLSLGKTITFGFFLIIFTVLVLGTLFLFLLWVESVSWHCCSLPYAQRVKTGLILKPGSSVLHCILLL
jgi:hypothetical protein